jgi:histidinol-phosphatase (PHP family)
MIANYHTHTARCRHAGGTEEEYVLCAVQSGLKILGFSDHTPYPFPQWHRSSFRMTVQELPGYVDTVLQLRKAYAGQLEIPLGLEVEYYPSFFPQLLPILKDHGIEYMLLGQHFLYDEVEGISSAGPTADESRLQQYCNQTIDAMHTGLFTYFAHPDLVNFLGSEDFYRQQIRRLCRAAKECAVPLEINLLGFRDGRHYPNRRFWEVAAEENCSVIFGIDAHQPYNFGHLQALEKAQALAQELGLQVLDTVPLRPLK